VRWGLSGKEGRFARGLTGKGSVLASKGTGLQSGQSATGKNFGNVKLGAGGGLTLGFWGNKNGKGVLQSNESAQPPLVSAVQKVTVAQASGTFTLTFNGKTTASLAYNASASSVQSALKGLSTIGGVGGSVTVNSSANTYTVTFGGSLAGTNVSQMTAGGTAGATVSTLVAGGPNPNNWRVVLNGLGLRDKAGNLFSLSYTDSFATAYSNLATWLGGATGTNMSYMLSAQLATMDLNVTMAPWNSFGAVNPNALIYAPGTLTGLPAPDSCPSTDAAGFNTVQNVMRAAVSELAGHPVNAKNSSNQYYQGPAGSTPTYGTGSAAIYTYAQALKDALDNGNQNAGFVQGGPMHLQGEAVEAGPTAAAVTPGALRAVADAALEHWRLLGVPAAEIAAAAQVPVYAADLPSKPWATAARPAS
jgi:hypothetical protein